MKYKKSIVILTIVLTILIFTLSNPLYAATWQIKSTDGGEGMSNNGYIQNIIDNKASKGDTLLFKDKSYNHIHITINKPLNIISKYQSKIYTCPQENPTGSDQRVPFVITNKGKGTKISGFNIINNNENGYGILINSVSNVKIENNKIESKGNGIKVLKSSGTNLKGNTIKGANVGLNISDSKNVKILSNKVYGNIFGVESARNDNLQISSNSISLNKVHGVILQGKSNKNIAIKSNNINKNRDSSSSTFDAGICINGSFSNLKISSNMIKENGKYGILITEKASRTKAPTIEYNYISNNKNLKGSDGYDDREIIWFENFANNVRHPFKIGYNFFGKERSYVSLCASTNTGIILWDFRKTSTKGIYQLYYKKTDDDGKYNGIAKNMISHRLKVYLNYGTSKQVSKTVLVKNGIAKIDFRKASFKSSGNKLYCYNIVEKTFSIKNSEIPKRK